MSDKSRAIVAVCQRGVVASVTRQVTTTEKVLARIQTSANQGHCKRCASHVGMKRTAVDWLKQADDFFDKENWTGLLNHMLYWTKTCPEDAEAWFYLGLAYVMSDHFDEAIEAYREAIRINQEDAITQWHSGLDPELRVLGAELAGYHIEAGARSFVAYSQKMISDLGDSVRPYLRVWYEAVRFYPGMDATGMDSEDTLDSNKLLSFPPTLDRDTYSKARPHFEAGWKKMNEAGRSLKEYVQYLVGTFKDLIPNIDTYVTYYLREYMVEIITNRKLRNDAGRATLKVGIANPPMEEK